MIVVEMLNQARRGRTLLALGAMAAIPVLIGVALTFGDGPEAGEGPPFLSLVTSNGLLLPISAVAATSRFFLLVVTTLFLGEAFASECAWGTERYLLIRPVARRRYLGAKLVVGELLVLVAVSVVAAAALGTGAILFGIEPVRLFGSELSVTETVVRIGGMVAYVAFDLLVIGTFSLLIAVLTESASGAVIGAVGLGVTSQILDAIGALGDIRRFLPTHYWDAWIELFRTGTAATELRTGLLLGAAYSVAFALLAFWFYDNKDITS